MSKMWLFFLSLLLSFLFFVNPVTVSAQVAVAKCADAAGVYVWSTQPSPILEFDDNTTPTKFTIGQLTTGNEYRLKFLTSFKDTHYSDIQQPTQGQATFTVIGNGKPNIPTGTGNIFGGGSHQAIVEFRRVGQANWEEYCKDLVYEVQKTRFAIGDCLLTYYPADPKDNEQIKVSVTKSPAGQSIPIRIDNQHVGIITVGSNGQGETIIGPLFASRQGQIGLIHQDVTGSQLTVETPFCQVPITITAAGTSSPRSLPTGPGIPSIAGGGAAAAGGIPCGDDPKDPGIKTAIGCIHTSPVGFIKDFLRFILGISGGLAFLLMLLGAFQMLTSAGNPETLSAGKDRLQSAIIGLLFIIFAVLLLQIIGFDILNLPGFGR